MAKGQKIGFCSHKSHDSGPSTRLTYHIYPLYRWQSLVSWVASPSFLGFAKAQRRENHPVSTAGLFDHAGRYTALLVSSARPGTILLDLAWIAKMGSRAQRVDRGGSRGYIVDLYVVPAARRQGHGTASVWTVFAQLDKRGIESVEVDVRRDNPSALAFWEAQGFRIVPYRMWQFRDPQRARRMSGASRQVLCHRLPR